MRTVNGLRVTVRSAVDLAQWDRWVAQRSNVFQTSGWTRVMMRMGQEPIHVIAESDGVPVAGLVTSVRLPGAMGWRRWLGRLVPMAEGAGRPFGVEDPFVQTELLRALERECRKRGVAGIEWTLATTGWDSDVPLSAAGFRVTRLHTYRVRTEQGPDALWKGLHSKRRNEVRRAQKDHVWFEKTEDIERYTSLSLQMADRLPGFQERHHILLHRAAWEELSPSRSIHLFIAGCGGERLAGVLVLVHARRAYALWGWSVREGKKNAPSLLYWEVLRWCSSEGIELFDFLPAPASAQSGSAADTISRFKRQFGGDEVEMFSAARWISPVRMRLLDGVRRWRERFRANGREVSAATAPQEAE